MSALVIVAVRIRKLPFFDPAPLREMDPGIKSRDAGSHASEESRVLFPDDVGAG